MLTKAQFVARANAICVEDRAEMLDNVAGYRREWRAEHSAASPFTREAIDVLLPAVQFMYDHINFAGPPKGDEIEAENVLQTLQLTFVSSFERSIHSAEELSTRFTRFNRLAERYGLDDCLVTKAFLQPDIRATTLSG